MLESKQIASFEYYPNLTIRPSLHEQVARWIGDLIFLFLPEDTTDTTDRKVKDSTALPENRIRSTAKSLFWIAASVLFAIGLGQLN